MILGNKKWYSPFNSQTKFAILLTVNHTIIMMLVQRIKYWGLTNYPQIDIFLYSHHLSDWYCIDIVRRNSVLVTHGSSKVKGVNFNSYCLKRRTPISQISLMQESKSMILVSNCSVLGKFTLKRQKTLGSSPFENSFFSWAHPITFQKDTDVFFLTWNMKIAKAISSCTSNNMCPTTSSLNISDPSSRTSCRSWEWCHAYQ